MYSLRLHRYLKFVLGILTECKATYIWEEHLNILACLPSLCIAISPHVVV